MCGLPLQSAPGEVLRYSNVGIGVAGRVLEHVTGKSVIEPVRETILNPMGLGNIVAQPTSAERERVTHTANAAHAGTLAESYNSEWWQQSAITWGGYFGSPTDLARFAASFFPGEASPLPNACARDDVDQTGGVPGGVNVARVHWERAPGDRDGKSWQTSAITGPGPAAHRQHSAIGVNQAPWSGPIPSASCLGGIRYVGRPSLLATTTAALGGTQRCAGGSRRFGLSHTRRPSQPSRRPHR